MDKRCGSLLQDLCLFSEHGRGHLPTLVSRLEEMGTALQQPGSEGGQLVTHLVDTYFTCLGCSKLSKQIEKVLSSVPPSMAPVVESQMTVRVQELLTNTDLLHKVSCVMEQSKVAREVIHRHLSDLCCCLHTTIASILHEDAQPQQAATMYTVVKITLQVAQHFSEDLRRAVWLHNQVDAEHLTEHVSLLFQNLLAVLTCSGYSPDVYLFGGTSVAMLLNQSPDPHASVESLGQIFQVIADGSGCCHLGHLKMNILKMDGQESNSFAELALIRAVLMCCRPDILSLSTDILLPDKGGNSCQVPVRDNQLLVRLFPRVVRLCGAQTSNQYHAFQILSHWFKSLHKCLPILHSNHDTVGFTSKDSVYLEKTLKLVFLNWDSPVDGVAVFVCEIFQAVLSVWSWERTYRGMDSDRLSEELLSRLLDIPWYAKGKYKLLKLLLPYIDIRKLFADACLKGHLLQCMATNDLSPPAADVYKSCLQQIRNVCEEENQLTLWREAWLDVLLAGLFSDEPLLFRKMCDYWIPMTLKLLPVSAAFLLRHVCELRRESLCEARRRRALCVWLVILRSTRNKGLQEQDFNVQLLTEALYSRDEEVRGEAVAFLCITMKQTELLTEKEVDLLKSGLPLCLRVDSAPFRQNLASSMKKLMIRLRDGCLAGIKKNQQERELVRSLGFLDWLHGTLMDSLLPGASFQRRKTCLEILNVIYDTLVYVPGGGTPLRGQAQERCVQIVDYAHRLGLCDFFSWRSMVAVCSCITDGADEVQELSAELLMRFFPWSAPRQPGYHPGELACHLLRTALHLCSSPRPYETQSGALICNMVFVKYAGEQGAVFSRESGGGFTCTLTASSQAHPQFLQLLLEEIQQSLVLAKTNLVLASRQSSIHGLIQAITLCLKSRQAHCDLDLPESLLLDLLKVSVKVIQMTLSVTSGGNEKESCPSFAELGVALDSLVSGEQEGESLSLTPQFQFMLSWCWVNLKESCTCLGEVTACLVSSRTSERPTWLSELQGVGQMYVQVLTSCRIRGAIEGCRHGFLRYCSALMSCDEPALAAIPADILYQIMSSLESNLMSASVTRRSAGLPVIVQVIAQAEQRRRQHRLLTQSVVTLFRLASAPFMPQADQTQDVCQVHALNILKALFGDATLVLSLMPRYTEVLLIIFDGFESPSWAIRNAATQLFGTMVSRMFGPRGKAGTSQKMMTFQEFSAHYPHLPAAMLSRLETPCTNVDSVDNLRPSLFLVLTLLASLGPAESQSTDQIERVFREKVSLSLHSPVYTLRELSARAAVTFIPLDSGEQEALKLVASLPTSRDKIQGHNLLHGALLCAEKLILSREFNKKFKHRLMTAVLDKCWIHTELRHCPLIAAKYVQIMKHLIQDCDSEESLRMSIVSLFKSTTERKRSSKLQIGTGLEVKDSMLCITHLLGDSPGVLTRQCCDWLQLDDCDVCSVCLDILLNMAVNSRTSSVDWTQIQRHLWMLLRRDVGISALTAAMSLLAEIHLHQLTPEHSDFTMDDLHRVQSLCGSGSSLHAASIQVEAILVNNTLRLNPPLTDSFKSSVQEWCRRVHTMSDPRQNDSMRSAAVKALLVAGETILGVFVNNSNKLLPESVLSCVMDSVFTLLEDGDADIRDRAAQFVSSLHWEQRHIQFSDVDSSTCQKMFCQYISTNLTWPPCVPMYLLEKIYRAGEIIQACRSNRLNTRSEVLFEQEDSSILSEKPLQQQMYYSAVRALLRGSVDMLPASYVAQTAAEILTDLTTCIPVLQKSLQNAPILNISSDSSVYSSVAGLILVADVVVTVADAAVAGDIQTGLAELGQITDLHPGLRDMLNKLLSDQPK